MAWPISGAIWHVDYGMTLWRNAMAAYGMAYGVLLWHDPYGMTYGMDWRQPWHGPIMAIWRTMAPYSVSLWA
jgi:hypothetical protein